MIIPTWFLVVIMISTGSLNTLLNKFQDKICIENCESADEKFFEEPVWQTVTMFLGETFCLVFYFIKIRFFQNTPESSDSSNVESPNESSNLLPRLEEPKKISPAALLFIPTLCDLSATTLMNVGLLFVAASIYQMLRGSVVIFTAILSTFFLQRKLGFFKWASLVSLCVGILLVGLTAYIYPDSTSEKNYDSYALVGIVFVVTAQILTASQFVIEEKLLGNASLDPLLAVGIEGSFGLFFAILIISVANLLFENPGVFSWSGITVIASNPSLLISSIGICCSIAMFNWSGLTVTQTVSATARSTIDTTRTLLIWIISVCIGWEKTVHVLQVVGFSVLIYSTFLFNDVVPVPPCLLGIAPNGDEEEI